MKHRHIIYAAQLLSIVFTPFYLPILGLIALFTLSYLALLPVTYKLLVLSIVFGFTVLLPILLIRLYRHVQGWSLFDLGKKERRMIPYIISIMCYFACVYVMRSMHIPHFMTSILTGALAIQILCAMVNAWWKISTHTAAIGGVAGAVFGFAEIFSFNPVWWLSAIILVAGMLGTSRMILRQHTLSQVVAGFLLGAVTGAVVILA